MESLDEFVKKLTGDYDESHNYDHHAKVNENCLLIMKAYGNELSDIDKKIIYYAAMLHDVVDHKYPNAEGKKILLEDFLKRSQLDEEMVRAILFVINNISYSKEVKNGYPNFPSNEFTGFNLQLIRDIVSDADKLEAIGQVGIDRCFCYTRASNSDLDENQIKQKVVEHSIEKLLRLKDSFIRTPKGKELAEAPHNLIEKFVARSLEELEEKN
jgi:uncharacterized protein